MRTTGVRRNQSTVYKFKRLHAIPNFNINTAGTSNSVALTFALSDLPDYTKYTGLFQQFALTYVKLTVIPSANVNTAPASTSSMVYYAVDYDDSVAPDQEDMLSKQGVRMKYTLRPWTVKLRPRVLGMVYESGGTTGYSPRRHTWLSTNDATVPHYGVKMWFSTPASNMVFRVHATYYLKFKGLSAGANT